MLFINTDTNELLDINALQAAMSHIPFTEELKTEVIIDTKEEDEHGNPIYATEIVVTQHESFKTIIFPADPSSPSLDEALLDTPYRRIHPQEKPEAPEGHKVIPATPPYNFDGVSYFEDWQTVPLTSDEQAAHTNTQLATLERIRWEYEIGGIVVGGALIPTRDRDKTLINGKITEAILTSSPDTATFNFTVGGTVVPMTIGQLKQIGIAIARHVQLCIDAAALVVPQIIAGDLKDDYAISLAFAQAYDTIQ